MKSIRSTIDLVIHTVLGSLLLTAPAVSQIIPDGTLPTDSIVDTPDCTSCTISGGTVRGNNLFHSFSQFSIETGGEAFFDNMGAITDIYTRVTGIDAISEIDGILRTNDASLVLINPNGFIFGSGASLDINGSFLATTAEKIVFDDGAQLETSENLDNQILTVTAPVGLGFGSSPEPIVALPATVLELFSNQTLALVGGEISLEGSEFYLEEGRVELGSVAGNSIVGITTFADGWILDYSGVDRFNDINLFASAYIEASGDHGGDIQVYGRQVNLTDGGAIATFAISDQAGDLVVQASESITLETSPVLTPGIFNDVEGTADGSTAMLSVVTPQLFLRDGSEVSARTFGSGQAPNVEINVSDVIEVSGVDQDGFQSTIGSVVAEDGSGQGGVLRVTTDDLILRDGGRITASTFGSGDAGNLSVDARNVTISGTIPGIRDRPSGLFAQVNEQASGEGGTLTLFADNLTILAGGQTSTVARSDGRGGQINLEIAETIRLDGVAEDAEISLGRSGIFVGADLGSNQPGGDLTLTADRLVVENGANISADNIGTANTGANIDLNVRQLVVQSGGRIGAGSTLGTPPNGGQGPGGELTINASESVTVIGTGVVGNDLVRSTVTTVAEGLGDGGNLRIVTPRLTVQDDGEVSANAIAQGNAGNIFLVVPDELRINDSEVSTEAQQSAGGGISIESKSIVLTGNGDIRTNVASGAANGGTILIQADSLVALDDSDILAFAQDGAGGNITLPAFFGQNFEQAPPGTDLATLDGNSQVDVNATGQLSSGTITFPDVSFIENSLSELPDAPIDTDTLVASSCIAPTALSSGRLLLTGADGIPQQPGSTGGADVPTGSIRTFPAETAESLESQEVWQIGNPIAEPGAVYQLTEGRLVLSRRCSSF